MRSIGSHWLTRESLADEGVNDISFSCDGSFDTIVNFGDGGDYRVDFSGSFTDIDLGIQNNKDKLRTVEQWGTSTWTDLRFAFENVTELAITASDVPDLSSVTSLEGMFKGATNFNSAINNWDVSHVTDMGSSGEGCDTGLFMDATSFNQPLDSWDVSSVTDFSCMFHGATDFNQPLDSWDISGGMRTINMFEDAISFNQPLNNWNTHNLVYIYGMFHNATAFNQPLNNWDTTSVTGLTGMFAGAVTFNQDLSTWDFSGVTFFSSMFEDATAFNQSLENWSFNDEDILTDMLAGSGMSSRNYARTLEWWASLNLMPDTNFGREDMGSIPTTYCDTAQAARDSLIANGWTITDLGAESCVAESEQPEDGGNGSGTQIGVRAERLEALRAAVAQASTTAVTGSMNGFLQSLKKLLQYLTDNEEEISNLNSEETSHVIVTLRNALLLLLKLLPGM